MMEITWRLMTTASFIFSIVKWIGDQHESAFFFLLVAILFAIQASSEARGE